SRAAARAYATAAGAGFALVHVSTPLEECERRDRKGLYAKARAGLLTGMTGIDDAYEPPAEPELTIDTTDLPIGDAASTVLRLLAKYGWIDSRGF
ncbi:MAG: adenylyl-sulfate kinase, partial [Dactylosporangium sp.]|nr:adenylyl-sulfate kinase [Dactylosporangium sp.]NNJ60396.1 adenylyl-sulfate kinase [Dactylosporangium sp.]